MSITAITRDARLEFVAGQMVHQLSEDSLTEIHHSLSEMVSRLGGAFLGSDCAGKTQIEKTEFTHTLLISRGLFGSRKF
jgi:hypothetical protein